MENRPSRVLEEFEKIIEGAVDEFIAAAKVLGEPLTTLADMAREAFLRERDIISFGIKSLPPPQPDSYSDTYVPLITTIGHIQDLRNRNRQCQEFFNHMSVVSESIDALKWIPVRPAPTQYIREVKESADYYGNRVLSSNKGDPRHMNFINKWKEVLRALEQYVKDYHLTGFSWGCAVDPVQREARQVHGAVPPAPPPPPPNVYDPLAGGDNRHALLEQLNQGVDIVRMLKPVKLGDGQEQAPHAHAPVAARGDAPISRGPAPGLTTPSPRLSGSAPRNIEEPPKFILEGRKWRVDYQKNHLGMVIDSDDMSQSLAMFRCENSSLEVRKKINGVTIDTCKKTNIALNAVISSVELIRCQRVQVQCNGHVPLMSIDNSDSVQVFLPKEARGIEIVSSKSSSCNVCLLEPDGT
ncbi:Adenylyl cyclase-associated protein 2, partial [Stegodyphus mimosarum]